MIVVNPLGGGKQKLPEGGLIIKICIASEIWTVPVTGTYRIVAIGKGGRGGRGGWWNSSGVCFGGGGGGAGGIASSTKALKKGDVVAVTISDAVCSFGDIVSAVKGNDVSYGLQAGGLGGTGAGDQSWQGGKGADGIRDDSYQQAGGGSGGSTNAAAPYGGAVGAPGCVTPIRPASTYDCTDSWIRKNLLNSPVCTEINGRFAGFGAASGGCAIIHHGSYVYLIENDLDVYPGHNGAVIIELLE